MNLRLSTAIVGLLLAGSALGQHPAALPLPGPAPSPLLFVRFAGPEGMRTTFYQGRAQPRVFPAPVTVGMRPGYLYRVQLGNLPNWPGLTLYPTIEVRGSLCLGPRCSASCFPATIHLTPDDIEAVANGSLITKVIYLEHPDRAEPTSTKNTETLESDIPRDRDIYTEARNRGRIMLVVHLGERVPLDAELIATNVPGTILLPGEKVIGPAASPPCIPSLRKGLYDPWHGPRPLDEECLHDGGDRLAPVGFDRHGQLAGVDPEDTVAEYRDSKGRRQITCSNRVCLCVPRFVALRKECPLARSEGVVGPVDRMQAKGGALLEERVPSLTTSKIEHLKRFDGRVRPSTNVNVEGLVKITALKVLQAREINMGPVEAVGTKRVLLLTEKQKAEVVKQLELVKQFSKVVHLAGHEQIEHTSVTARVKGGPETITATVAVRDLTVCCHETPIPPEKPLVLIKCADRACAKPGEIVTFTIRYSNVGGRPITDVAVADSLSGRLEYVPGSTESDRDAVFTAQDNEAGSQLLRWEITGTLLPGQSGRIRFKAKVR
jgi:uncharacterized repeat protein (TIGR01451 family)